jgi:prepilin-type N-terminal cleavage/methylation domain-containing protein
MKASLPAARAGFTMLELVVSLVIACLLATGAVLAASEGREAYRSTHRRSSLEAELRRALDHARRELVDTGEGVLSPNPTSVLGTADLLFRRPLGLDGDEIEWGPALRLAREYEEGETNDGTDEDGDGLVDEGMLVFTSDDGGPDERRLVLCRGVSELLEGELPNVADDNGNGLNDESGFNVHRVDDVLTLRLSLEEPHPNTGRIVRTLTTAVRLRNVDE